MIRRPPRSPLFPYTTLSRSAPSLFLGATAGGFVGLFLRQIGGKVEPSVYAMVGMGAVLAAVVHAPLASVLILLDLTGGDRKSTRLNSSHRQISYAVFCLKKK